jgi:hypothetical protein
MWPAFAHVTFLPLHHVGELLEGHKNVLWKLTSESNNAKKQSTQQNWRNPTFQRVADLM